MRLEVSFLVNVGSALVFFLNWEGLLHSSMVDVSIQVLICNFEMSLST